jgi:hypothetical protein
MVFSHITYKDKIKRGASELKRTNPKEIMKYGWKQWDDYL